MTFIDMFTMQYTVLLMIIFNMFLTGKTSAKVPKRLHHDNNKDSIDKNIKPIQYNSSLPWNTFIKTITRDGYNAYMHDIEEERMTYISTKTHEATKNINNTKQLMKDCDTYIRKKTFNDKLNCLDGKGE